MIKRFLLFNSDRMMMLSFPGLKSYYRLLQRGFHRPFLENYTNISDVLSYYLNLAIRKELTVDEALKMASEKINSESILIK